MLYKTWSAAIQGVDAVPVEVEVNTNDNAGNDEKKNLIIVGLPDTAVRESRERVWSAIYASECLVPEGYSTINLAPADIKKEGASFDLPIAIALAACSRGLDAEKLQRVMLAGELALDGTIRPVYGALAIALEARKLGLRAVLLPEENAEEAAVVEGIRVYGVKHLTEALQMFEGIKVRDAVTVNVQDLYDKARNSCPDMLDVKGQETAKRALEVAAAGGHNLLFIGPPGTGKSMLAKRLPSILPPLNLDEALEVTRVHSIAGQLDRNSSLIVNRPFRSPHHTVSDAGLLGGQSMPRPGEISLAHNGVLFLDELPEFKRNVLEVLRQPLENGNVTISRSLGAFTFPADIMLVAAMNPCPCGFYGSGQRSCRCTTFQRERYRSRISGPLLDRIDIHVEVPHISEELLMKRRDGESSATIRQRVIEAIEFQGDRFVDSPVNKNARIGGAMLDEVCQLRSDAANYLRSTISQLNMSARAYDRILRVARTIADLAKHELIELEDVSEAIQFRSLDRTNW